MRDGRDAHAYLSPDRRPRQDQALVLSAYARWAPIYDFVFARLFGFGAIFDRGRSLAIAHINTRQGTVLEVGVGTGIALSRYQPHLAITGIDLSPDMLAVARRRVMREHMSHVRDLIEMDAAALTFESESFDTVAVMYTITVVPRPELVLDEVARVLKPGGEAVIVSHFAANHGWRGGLERLLVPLTRRLGWRSDFPLAGILNHPDLALVETSRLAPFGVFSIVRLRKTSG
jgi:phosphatidylethanolamine/phosphatidyl-N-methylethanolamine N-methyltransferase